MTFARELRITDRAVTFRNCRLRKITVTLKFWNTSSKLWPVRLPTFFHGIFHSTERDRLLTLLVFLEEVFGGHGHIQAHCVNAYVSVCVARLIRGRLNLLLRLVSQASGTGLLVLTGGPEGPW